MFIPDPDFYPSRIPDPKTRTKKKVWHQICGYKKIWCHTFFCSHKFYKIVNYFIFEVLKKTIWPSFQRIVELSTQSDPEKSYSGSRIRATNTGFIYWPAGSVDITVTHIVTERPPSLLNAWKREWKPGRFCNRFCGCQSGTGSDLPFWCLSGSGADVPFFYAQVLHMLENVKFFYNFYSQHLFCFPHQCHKFYHFQYFGQFIEIVWKKIGRLGIPIRIRQKDANPSGSGYTTLSATLRRYLSS